jgi:hypothetical protein
VNEPPTDSHDPALRTGLIVVAVLEFLAFAVVLVRWALSG